MKHQLIMFTRFPVPGKTKTRLIHELGEEGAARLQEIMTGRMMLQARTWQAGTASHVQVQFTGAKRNAFENWLGHGVDYVHQHAGSLGDRMADAFQMAFRAGRERVVLIGSDCPELNESVLNEAFVALDQNDVVLGPAIDGGYYLIGMKKPLPHLFHNMAWGSEHVLQQTLEVLKQHGHSCAILNELQDVDYPKDLPVWKRAWGANEPGSISVVIPALNEAATIEAAIASALTGAHEVIVADGGSEDQTREIAEAAGARVIHAPRGRSYQMNTGALHAQGEYVVFLHADSVLPDGFAIEVQDALGVEDAVIGAFSLSIDHPAQKYRWIERGVQSRSHRRRLPFGDQSLFLRRDTFFRMGGFYNKPLLEDVELVKRALHRGRLVMSNHCVRTSARRWEKKGVLMTTALNQLILVSYQLGASPEFLAKVYDGFGRRGH